MKFYYKFLSGFFQNLLMLKFIHSDAFLAIPVRSYNTYDAPETYIKSDKLMPRLEQLHQFMRLGDTQNRRNYMIKLNCSHLLPYQ